MLVNSIYERMSLLKFFLTLSKCDFNRRISIGRQLPQTTVFEASDIDIDIQRIRLYIIQCPLAAIHDTRLHTGFIYTELSIH